MSGIGSEFPATGPTQEKQDAHEKQRAGYAKVGRPMEPAPEREQVNRPQADEQNATRPFPPPGDGQHNQHEPRWNQMDQQSQDGLPEAVVGIEHVGGKETQEAGKQKAQDSGRPEQQSF